MKATQSYLFFALKCFFLFLNFIALHSISSCIFVNRSRHVHFKAKNKKEIAALKENEKQLIEMEEKLEDRDVVLDQQENSSFSNHD